MASTERSRSVRRANGRRSVAFDPIKRALNEESQAATTTSRRSSSGNVTHENPVLQLVTCIGLVSIPVVSSCGPSSTLEHVSGVYVYM